MYLDQLASEIILFLLSGFSALISHSIPSFWAGEVGGGGGWGHFILNKIKQIIPTNQEVRDAATLFQLAAK